MNKIEKLITLSSKQRVKQWLKDSKLLNKTIEKDNLLFLETTMDDIEIVDILNLLNNIDIKNLDKIIDTMLSEIRDDSRSFSLTFSNSNFIEKLILFDEKLIVNNNDNYNLIKFLLGLKNNRIDIIDKYFDEKYLPDINNCYFSYKFDTIKYLYKRLNNKLTDYFTLGTYDMIKYHIYETDDIHDILFILDSSLIDYETFLYLFEDNFNYLNNNIKNILTILDPTIIDNKNIINKYLLYKKSIEYYFNNINSNILNDKEKFVLTKIFKENKISDTFLKIQKDVNKKIEKEVEKIIELIPLCENKELLESLKDKIENILLNEREKDRG